MLNEEELRRIISQSHVPAARWTGRERSEKNAEILLALARGIDELQSADTESRRRYERAVEALVEGAKALRGEMHENAGKRWTEEETERLNEAMWAGMSLSEMAKMMGRSERAVWMKLEKMRPAQMEQSERRGAVEAAWRRMRDGE